MDIHENSTIIMLLHLNLEVSQYMHELCDGEYHFIRALAYTGTCSLETCMQTSLNDLSSDPISSCFHERAVIDLLSLSRLLSELLLQPQISEFSCSLATCSSFYSSYLAVFLSFSSWWDLKPASALILIPQINVILICHMQWYSMRYWLLWHCTCIL